MPTVELPSALRPHARQRASVRVRGATVGEALRALAAEHPALAQHLFDEQGQLKRYVSVFVGDEDVRGLELLETKVGEADVLVLVQAIAGG